MTERTGAARARISEEAETSPGDRAHALNATVLMMRVATEIEDIAAGLHDIESQVIPLLAQLKRDTVGQAFPKGLQRIDLLLQRLHGISGLLAAIAPDAEDFDPAQLEASVRALPLANQKATLLHGASEGAEGAGASIVLF